GDDQIGIVEGGAVGVREGVAEFTTLVDRSRGLGGDVAGNAAGERELAEQAPHAVLIAGDVRVDLAVGAFEPRRGHRSGSAVTGTHDVHHVQVAGGDGAVEVRVDEVQSRCGARVSEQPRFDVFGPQRFAQQRIVHEV